MVSLTARPIPATIRSYRLSVADRACQSVVFDRRTGQAYVVQPSGHDTVVSRVTFNGAQGVVADKHVLEDGGHGSAIALKIIDGQPWIGTQWGSPTVWVRYGGGRSETFAQAKAAGRTQGIPESAGNTIVASDLDHDLLVYCTRGSDPDKMATFTVRRLSAPSEPVLATRTVPSVRPVFQGMWISGDLVFTPKGYGHSNQKQQILWWNWRTGATGGFRCRWLPESWRVQEPEGGYSTVDAAGRTHYYLQVSARDDSGAYRYFLVEFELTPDPTNPPDTTQPEKGEHIMASGTSVYEMLKQKQALPAGSHEIKATSDGKFTMLTGPISDVDIVTTVAYTGGENVTVQHRIVDFAEGNKKTLLTRLPAPGAAGCAQASFKGELPKPSAAGRSMRLRVVITSSKPITVTDVQTSGWRL